MSTIFSGAELINIAIDIERRGISFYDVMAKSSENDLARAAFAGLAGMEREHLKTFQGMLRENDAEQSRETPPAEYPAYVRSLIDAAVFSDDLITGEMATQADTDVKAVELGINAEKDSLLFYYEMRDSLPHRVLPVINRIIAEEKTHLQQLAEIKRELTASR
ncbi:MAG: hypothetical protein A2Y92_01380 [Chloroflexi bacterium RBG_13_57_8]|nr:MAG: hypothetical protein A2Y92_01380 [Chloroflexi bacterium RBG_13_57_8]